MIDFEEDIGSSSKDGTFQVDESSNWVSKYRPHDLEHFCLEQHLKKSFKNQIDNNDIQNCSLIGTQGIGKTTLALILANSNPENDILFIPCATEGKVETIQSKIIPFCQSASRGTKVIILDELDSASATQSNSFQKALRNVCEIYRDCRWIATANYQQNIISPVLSRLPPIALSFNVSDMINHLLYILGGENIQIKSDAAKVKHFLGQLIKSGYPDLRLVIGQLQAACVGGKLDVENIAINNKEAIKNALSQFLGLVKTSGTPLEMRKAYNNEILAFGNDGNLSKLCSPLGLAEELFNYLVENCNVVPEDLMELVEYIWKIEHSVDGETQFFGFLLKVKTINFSQNPK